MTNPDTSTLNGSLEQLGITMAANLVAKNVQASPSDGLTTLANKILDIQTGSNCYHIEFSEDSYTVVGGSVTLECTLQQNYAPLANATVTLTDGNSLYWGVTDSDGVATFVLTGLSSGGTYTCIYQNVSDTCSVVIPTYLFYDACDSTYKSENYGTPIGISSSPQTNYSTYNSTENAYLIRANKDWGLLPIPALTGLDNYKLSAYFKPAGSSHLYRGGFGFLTENTTSPFISWRIQGDRNCHYTPKVGSSEPNTTIASNLDITVYHKIEIIKEGNTYTGTIYDTDGTTVLGTNTVNYTLADDVVAGLYLCCGSSYGCYVKEIKAESI